MIDRYQNQRIRGIWSEAAKYGGWAAIEFEYLAVRGIRRPWFADLVTKVTVETVREKEKETGHDVAAFVAVFCDLIEAREPGLSREFHYRLTSSDLVDTWNGVCLVRSIQYLVRLAEELRSDLQDANARTQGLMAVGRTHGQAAVPVPFGDRYLKVENQLKFAIVGLRAQIHFSGDYPDLGKIGGPTGSEIPEYDELQVLAKFGLSPAARPAGQCVDRIKYFRIAAAVMELGLVLDGFAQDLRLLAIEEVGEVAEGYPEGRIGSSSMPHKKNPVTLEKINGLVRVLRGHFATLTSNTSLWLERDISHSSVERLVLPDFFEISAYCLVTLAQVVKDLVVNPSRVQSNLEAVKEKMGSFERLHQSTGPRMESYQNSRPCGQPQNPHER